MEGGSPAGALPRCSRRMGREGGNEKVLVFVLFLQRREAHLTLFISISGALIQNLFFRVSQFSLCVSVVLLLPPLTLLSFPLMPLNHFGSPYFDTHMHSLEMG